MCGLRFPIHPLILHLLNELQIAPGQLVPNAWRMVISCMANWVFTCDREMITVNDFLFLYHLKASTHYGYFKLLPWDRKFRIVRGFPSSFCDWKSRYFFLFLDWVRKPCLMIFGEKSQDCYGNGKFQCLVHISVISLCSFFIP